MLESERGNFDIFNERSFRKAIAAYCTLNVIFLPELGTPMIPSSSPAGELGL